MTLEIFTERPLKEYCTPWHVWYVWYVSNMLTLSGFELQDLVAGRSRSARMSLGNRQCALLNLRYQ